jgi:hypothetical protein
MSSTEEDGFVRYHVPADADELVARSSPAFRGHGATSALAHLRVTGGHALESERFDAIIRWMTNAASAPA